MAHKFADKWRSFVLRNGIWEEDGEIDLKNMDEHGHLENGSHSHGFKLKGEALANELLNLHTDPELITYSGFLIFEQGNKMTLLGIEHFVDEEARAKMRGQDGSPKSLAQDEEPWIITKP